MSKWYEFLALFAVAALIIGAGMLIMRWRLWWLMRRLRFQWRTASRTVHVGPLRAMCNDRLPHDQDVTSYVMYGVLAVVDDRFVFSTPGHNFSDLNVQVGQLRWLGLRPVVPSQHPQPPDALVVHLESPFGWRVYEFCLSSPRPIAEQIAARCGLPVRELTTEREDHGPADAMRMTQDVLGQWEADFTAELYLAPDRLLFGWQDAIPLESIRALAIYPESGLGELNPFAEELLRIDYEEGHGRATVGFRLRHADRWAEVIGERADVPLEVVDPRTKKAT